MANRDSDDSRPSTAHLDGVTVGGAHHHGYFDKDPTAVMARKIYTKVTIGGVMSLIIVIFTLFSIYWGALWKTTSHFHNIHVWVVDFDHGPVGNAVVSAIQALPYAPERLTWIVKDASEFPNGPSDLAAKVDHQDIWLAVAINPSASSALTSAISAPQQSGNYNGSSAITAFGEEARAENAFRGVLRPQLEAVLQPIASQFANQFAARNISSLPQEQVAAIMTSAPQLLTRPIYYTIDNLHPFDVPVATAVTFVGLIYLLILGFQLTMISFGARQLSGLEDRLHLRQLITLRVVTPFILYFFLSLFYSLLSLAFQAPFERYYGKSGFVIYWMLQWWGMLALGLAMESMITLLGQKFISMFLVLWVVVNVSVCFFPMEMLPGLYKYGHASPFYNVSQGVRSIMFGCRDRLGLNFGVLIAWSAISVITTIVFTVLTRVRARKQAARNSHVGDAEKRDD